MSSSESELVERLLEEFVERLHRGERPSIADYESRYPQCAEQIREFFAAAQAVEQMAQRRVQGGGPDDGADTPVEQLGDYRLTRQIGRGGMGIVYEAQQVSLGRRVAVKVLPQSSLLDPKSLRRFQREARAAARLHHSNIIPVFGVGEHQGYHYIVMQLIQGVGLDNILRQLARDCAESNSATLPPTAGCADDCTVAARALLQGDFALAMPASNSSASLPHAEAPTEESADRSDQGQTTFRLGPRYWQSITRIGIQSAAALQYAHSRGTLHRDIKPANLLLDLQGVVWIGDFGLAKIREHDEASQTGDIPGTLRYMAPERFQGQVDARSDVYSLGLTLYELLTLRPAYERTHPSELLRRIAVEPPPTPRSIEPQIPADLETIVLKAIAREPIHRYASAGELADDLQRFLDDRPIRARRVGPIERVWRWARRNRTVAALTGLAALLLILVALVTSVAYVQTEMANRRVRESLARESQQREVAERQRRKAEAMSALMSTALDDIFQQHVPNSGAGRFSVVSEGSLDGEVLVPAQPVLSREVAAILEKMLTFYDRLAQQDAEDSQLRRKVADANRRVGDIRRRLGNFEQAQSAYERAIDRYEQLAREQPNDWGIPVEIARIHNDLGCLAWTARWQGDGRGQHRKALDVLLSRVWKEGQWGATGGLPTRASAALAGKQPLAPVPQVTLDSTMVTPRLAASATQARFELARTHYFLGRVAPMEAMPGRRPPPRPGDPPPAPIANGDRAELEQAIRLLEALGAENPTVPEYRHLLACCYRDLPRPAPGSAEAQPGDPQSRAIEILQKLVDDFPNTADYRFDLSMTYAAVDPREPRPGDDHRPAQEERLRESLKILSQLAAQHPDVPDYAASQVQVLYLLSEVLRRTHRPDDGQAALEDALQRQTRLIEQFPQVTPYKAWKAIVQESLAKLWANRGQTAKAREMLESAIAELDQVLQSEPQAVYVRRLLGRCCANLAEVLRQEGEPQQADDVLRRGRQYQAGP